jgi:hypothetical protein
MANQVLYGFHTLKDVLASRVSGSLIEATNEAIRAAVAAHNAAIDAAVGFFATRTTEHQRRYAQVGNARLQPLDENGRARPIKPSGYYDVAWPIDMGGSAWGANYVTRAKMTVADAERATAMMLTADAHWMRDHLLAALYQDDGYTFSDDLYGDLTVEGLANGDAVTYGMFSGAATAATDDHILADADAIADATNPYPTIRDELMEHPENAGQVVAFIPSGLRATTEALATFHPIADPNIRRGADNDELVGGLGVSHPGTLIGYEDSGVWIVEWLALPADYIVAATTDGERPLAMREDPEDELRGFQQVAERNDHPFYESQWLRRAGFGGWNRVGGLVMRIGNGTYAVPTGYTSPMP